MATRNSADAPAAKAVVQSGRLMLRIQVVGAATSPGAPVAAVVFLLTSPSWGRYPPWFVICDPFYVVMKKARYL